MADGGTHLGEGQALLSGHVVPCDYVPVIGLVRTRVLFLPTTCQFGVKVYT